MSRILTFYGSELAILSSNCNSPHTISLSTLKHTQLRINFLCYKKVKIGKKVHPIASSLRASKILLLSQLPSAALIWCLKYHNLLLSIYISQHPVILKHLHVHILKSSSKTCIDISFMLLCSAWQPWFDQFKSLYQFPTNVSTVSLTLFLCLSIS